jgi:hypothetical protein
MLGTSKRPLALGGGDAALLHGGLHALGEAACGSTGLAREVGGGHGLGGLVHALDDVGADQQAGTESDRDGEGSLHGCTSRGQSAGRERPAGKVRSTGR